MTMGGRTIRKYSAYDNGYQFGEWVRRTVYAPSFRNARLEILDLFDAANPNMVQGRRPRTTLATQALFLMNHPSVMERASAYAAKLSAERGSDGAKLERTYWRILGRPPEARERRLAREFLDEFTGSKRWAILTHSLFASVDFRTLP